MTLCAFARKIPSMHACERVVEFSRSTTRIRDETAKQPPSRYKCCLNDGDVEDDSGISLFCCGRDLFCRPEFIAEICECERPSTNTTFPACT